MQNGLALGRRNSGGNWSSVIITEPLAGPDGRNVRSFADATERYNPSFGNSWRHRSMELVLFDLDNTLLSGDSDFAWAQFLIGKGVVDKEAQSWLRAVAERCNQGAEDCPLKNQELPVIS
jgi:hypothetical protein